MKEDTNFLKSNDIIDYSFLIGCHTIDLNTILLTTENNTRKQTPEHKKKKFTNTINYAHIKLLDMEEPSNLNHII